MEKPKNANESAVSHFTNLLNNAFYNTDIEKNEPFKNSVPPPAKKKTKKLKKSLDNFIIQSASPNQGKSSSTQEETSQSSPEKTHNHAIANYINTLLELGTSYDQTKISSVFFIPYSFIRQK